MEEKNIKLQLTLQEKLMLENMSLKRKILEFENEKIYSSIAARLGIQADEIIAMNLISGEIKIKTKNTGEQQCEKQA